MKKYIKMQIERILKKLTDEIAEVYDLDLAEKMTETYEDIVRKVRSSSKQYWSLVGKLAAIEKERDELRIKLKEEEMKNRSMRISFEIATDTAKEMLDKERKLLETERDQGEYDRNYYRNELDKEIRLGNDVEFQKNFLMNKLTGCVDCKGCEFCE